MKLKIQKPFWNKIYIILLFLILIPLGNSKAQYKNVWMSEGKLNNWYSAIGCEIEEGFVARQQYGMQWPANYRGQDMQAARGWWLGCKDFTDADGKFHAYKVVTVGPRKPLFYAVTPISMKMKAKFEPTIVTVDGVPSIGKEVDIDSIDGTMPWDRMIINRVATQIGVTMERKIFQFSQQYNDSYIVYDYTFINTGDTDGDETTIELPSNTIHDLYTFWTYRNAVNASVRYVIGNKTGWGINTMNDTRGDGVKVDPPGEQFRCQFSWHGFTTDKDVNYNNIGGPIWALNSSALAYNVKSDTIGRLGGSQFLGVATLHADKSSSDATDDVSQPTTTSYIDSDGPMFVAGANALDDAQNQSRYSYMSSGHQSPRHADLVEPSGDFANQTANPNVGGGSGGMSFNNGYGPYTLGPGESVHIVMVEAAASMSRENQIKYGKQFKAGTLSAYDKNTYVINEGRDSLFSTFQNAKENFESGWNIPSSPLPPTTFSVNGGGDRIVLSWDIDATDPNPPTNFRIYRALGDYDADYNFIAEVGADERSYNDVNVIRGFDYYYYITAVGPNQSGGPGTPAGRLESSRFYTQTFIATSLKRPAENDMSKIRVVPNPYIISAGESVRFPGTPNEDKIAFYNIPGQCTIKIFTELGELIKTIEHTNGSGDEYWKCVTEYDQFVVSGIYIAVITNSVTGENKISKFVVIR